jgi:hypothetical protein
MIMKLIFYFLTVLSLSKFTSDMFFLSSSYTGEIEYRSTSKVFDGFGQNKYFGVSERSQVSGSYDIL